MTRLQKLLLGIVGILGIALLTFAAYWYLGVYRKEYTECLLKHRSGVHLETDRATVHKECKANLNPFNY